MITFKKILVTTDLSGNADAAIPYALDVAREYNGEVIVAYAYELQYMAIAAGGADPTMMDVEWLESMRKQHEENFKKYAENLKGKAADVKVRPIFLKGDAVDQVLALADKEKVDLIVLATHGRTGLAHFFYGSVAEKIVRLSTHPVLTIRPVEMRKKA